MSGEDEGEHESRRAAGYAAESRETTTRAAEFPARDRDPPPSYDGDNYEVTFRQYEKQVELLLLETEVPRVKRGIKLLRQLSGVAATAVDDMEVKEIASEDGVQNILSGTTSRRILKSPFQGPLRPRSTGLHVVPRSPLRSTPKGWIEPSTGLVWRALSCLTAHAVTSCTARPL